MGNGATYCLLDDVFLMKQLYGFESVGLNGLTDVELLNRKDTKYLFHINKLGALLARLKDGYIILKIDDKVIFSYQSNYYDTPGFRMYLEQHNEKADRYKVRTRTYLDSLQSYIEIKHKNNKAHTCKERARLEKIPIAEFVDQHTPYHFADLELKLIINFARITLVDKAFTERATIDTGLMYRIEDRVYHFPELVILELKQDRKNRQSAVKHILRDMRIFPAKLSKYCLGIMMHYRKLKTNRYKEKLRYIQRIIDNYE